MNPAIRHVLSRKPRFTQVEALRRFKISLQTEILQVGRPNLGRPVFYENCRVLLRCSLVPSFPLTAC
jgi:hypothetical protein